VKGSLLTIISHLGPSQLHRVSQRLFGGSDYPIYQSLDVSKAHI